jgi:hypothetical protein
MATRRTTLGNCCKAMTDALRLPNTLFRIEDNGVLYVTVAYAQTPQGVGWFDQAAMFCPFCGVQIQDRDAIRRTVP